MDSTGGLWVCCLCNETQFKPARYFPYIHHLFHQSCSWLPDGSYQMNMNTFYALDNWTQLTAYLNVDVNATSGSLPGLAGAQQPNCLYSVLVRMHQNYLELD